MFEALDLIQDEYFSITIGQSIDRVLQIDAFRHSTQLQIWAANLVLQIGVFRLKSVNGNMLAAILAKPHENLVHSQAIEP